MSISLGLTAKVFFFRVNITISISVQLCLKEDFISILSLDDTNEAFSAQLLDTFVDEGTLCISSIPVFYSPKHWEILFVYMCGWVLQQWEIYNTQWFEPPNYIPESYCELSSEVIFHNISTHWILSSSYAGSKNFRNCLTFISIRYSVKLFAFSFLRGSSIRNFTKIYRIIIEYICKFFPWSTSYNTIYYDRIGNIEASLSICCYQYIFLKNVFILLKSI